MFVLFITVAGCTWQVPESAIDFVSSDAKKVDILVVYRCTDDTVAYTRQRDAVLIAADGRRVACIKPQPDDKRTIIAGLREQESFTFPKPKPGEYLFLHANGWGRVQINK